ncbi:MAG: hypothetical protein C4560_02960 [Nitrospiraceae bacterium]|nr:MAG: hypothetical protein C4560_02960 [Nitrospiraceae bacterium]
MITKKELMKYSKETLADCLEIAGFLVSKKLLDDLELRNQINYQTKREEALRNKATAGNQTLKKLKGPKMMKALSVQAKLIIEHKKCIDILDKLAVKARKYNEQHG